MTKALQAAAKTCKGKEYRDQLEFIKQTFLTHREMGQSEILYRLMPHLHLSESNVKTIHVATGFPHNRSRMAWKVKDQNDNYNEEHDNGEDSAQARKREVHIPGKEGRYTEQVDVQEKYAARPEALEEMCLAQFATAFDTMPRREGNDIEFVEGISGESSSVYIYIT